MIRACKTVHEELGVLLHRHFRVSMQEGMVCIGNAERLRPAHIRPLITNLTFDIKRWGPSSGLSEREEKPYLISLLGCLPGLRELTIDGSDCSADSTEKGTAWKPKVLRRLDFILKNSENLSKVFYEGSHGYMGAKCRITEADGRAAGNVSTRLQTVIMVELTKYRSLNLTLRASTKSGWGRCGPGSMRLPHELLGMNQSFED